MFVTIKQVLQQDLVRPEKNTGIGVVSSGCICFPKRRAPERRTRVRGIKVTVLVRGVVGIKLLIRLH
jgi:hypothetical protein